MNKCHDKKIYSNKLVLIDDIKNNSFIIKNKKSYVSINKLNEEITKINYSDDDNQYNQNNQNNISKLSILGILGVIQGIDQKYLLTIEKTKYVGAIHKSNVFKILTIKLIKFHSEGSSFDLTTKEDLKVDSMIKDFLKRNKLYYSDSYDLTNSIQSYLKLVNINKSKLSKIITLESNEINKCSLFENTNKNFCWNYNISSCFDSGLLEGIVFAIINGYFGCRGL